MRAKADLEGQMREVEALQKRLARGRVELAISIQLRSGGAPSVELNEDFANALAGGVSRLSFLLCRLSSHSSRQTSDPAVKASPCLP